MNQERSMADSQLPIEKGSIKAASRNGRTNWWIVSLLVVTALCVGRIVGGQFSAWDDPHTLWQNDNFNPPNWEAIWEYWDYRKPAAGLWVPVTYTVWGILSVFAYGVEKGPRGEMMAAWPFHAASVVSHLVSTALVFLILRRVLQSQSGQGLEKGRRERLDQFGAWAGALVFGIHPLQVETLGWTSGLKDCLWVLCALGAVYCYLRSGERGLYWGSRWWWGGWLVFVVGSLCKPTAMVTPALCVVIHWLGMRQPLREVLWKIWPWFLFVPVIGLWTRTIQTGAGVETVNWLMRPLVVGDSLAFYLWKLFMPWGLTYDYGRNPTFIQEHGYIWWTWLVPAALGVVTWGWVRRMRRHPGGCEIGGLLAAGWVWAVVALSPVSGIIPFMYQFYSTVADHYVYGSMAGVGMVVAGLVKWAGMRVEAKGARVGLLGGAGVIGLILGGLTFRQMGTWLNDDAMIAQAEKVNPRTFTSYANKGFSTLLLARDAKQDRPDLLRLSIEYSDKALSLQKYWQTAWENKALAHALLGETNEAIMAIEMSLESQARSPAGIGKKTITARMLLGDVLMKRNRMREALERYQQALAETEKYDTVESRREAEAIKLRIKQAQEAIAAAATQPSTGPSTRPSPSPATQPPK